MPPAIGHARNAPPPLVQLTHKVSADMAPIACCWGDRSLRAEQMIGAATVSAHAELSDVSMGLPD
jgi:hypothetical protein